MSSGLHAPEIEIIESGGSKATADAIKNFWRVLTNVLLRLDLQELQGTRIPLHERSIDPPDPLEGNAVLWMSDGTGSGDDGDLLVKINVAGSIKTATLVDYSAA
jgi:hypothetical protein